ncbi:transcription factor CPC-like isoform X1 [Carex rostrata]
MDKMDIDSSSEDNSSLSRGAEESSEDSKTDQFSEDEEALIATMYRLIGERWALIAGRVPGRTAEEIEKYWTSRYSSSE